MLQSVRVELEDRACPNGCRRDDLNLLEGSDMLHGMPGRFTVVRCRGCGLDRTNPRPTPAAMGMFYPSDYGPYQSQAQAPRGATSGPKAWLKRLLRLDAKALPAVRAGRLMEIGCASGDYMAQVQAEGWSVQGIEFSDDAAEAARKRGFCVETATLEHARGPDQPVDLVAAWMVLEHLHDPVAALRKVRGWLRPEGVLVASVPDAGAIERRLFGQRWFALQLPTHLYHYTPATIASVLQTAGWQLTRVHWQRDCNNLLWSLEYWARDMGHARLLRAVRWLRTARAAGKLRMGLGWVLGALHQSGRMEIWARPLPAEPAPALSSATRS